MYIITLGEFLIDMIKDGEDPSLLAEKFLALPGGAPANVAVGIARLGVPVGFIGSVGNDSFGHRLIAYLKENKVDVKYVTQVNGTRTTHAYIFPRPDGKKDIFFYRNPGADQMLSKKNIKAKYFRNTILFHHGSISMIEDAPLKATLKAIKYIKKNHGLISFDPNYRPAIWPNSILAKKRIWLGFKYADIIKTSDEDLPFITDEKDVPKGAVKILNNSKATIVIVTLADKGCYFITRNGCSGFISGFKVKVIEVTGAGDAFSASMLVDLYKIWSKKKPAELTKSEWENILFRANAVGALACTKKGAIPAMPTTNELKQFLQQNKN